MTWIQTHSGRKFDLSNPKAEDVSLEDIAHALARINRFTGHTGGPQGYTVAQHSVLVSDMAMAMTHRKIPTILCVELGFRGLLHDAAEAYLGDVSAPVKALPELSGYRHLEARVEAVIREAFGTNYTGEDISQGLHQSLDESVKQCDLYALDLEARTLFPTGQHADWVPPTYLGKVYRAPESWVLGPVMDSTEAQLAFMGQFEFLTRMMVKVAQEHRAAKAQSQPYSDMGHPVRTMEEAVAFLQAMLAASEQEQGN